QVGITRLIYSDRYISSPLQILLLLTFFKELLSRLPRKLDTMIIRSLNLAEPQRRSPRRFVFSNWYPEEEDRRINALQQAIQDHVVNFSFEVSSDRKRVS